MTSEYCFCNLKIVNLSSKELTEGQIKLLSKGLKFTPTPRKDMCEISADIQNFCMKLREKEFFEDKSDASDTDESLAKNKSNFCPPRNTNITLDNYIDFHKICRNDLRAFALRNNSEGYKINKLLSGLLVHRRIMPSAERLSLKFHSCPRIFASRRTVHFSDNLSALRIILRYTSR